ncbi:MAG: LysR family transcriptional regulator [Gammaproteobacteria bacterium]|nr:MAG: LysR family transcriptional regulator [Gammaproteobacteria bacterium]
MRPRVYLGPGIALGPGKVDLLRKVGECGSISAAGRALGIPYKRAWLLIDTLNTGFGRPLVETATGGKGGGGAVLTSLGQQVVACYEALERRLNAEASTELAALRALLEPPEKK